MSRKPQYTFPVEPEIVRSSSPARAERPVSRSPGDPWIPTIDRGPLPSNPTPPRTVNSTSDRTERLGGAISGPDLIPIVYGTQLVEGRVISTYYDSSMHPYRRLLFIEVCGGPIDEITTVYADQEALIAVPYEERLGGLSQTECTAMTTWYGGSYTFPGIAFIHLPWTLEYGASDQGWKPLPSADVKQWAFLVKGMEVLDTRTSTTGYSTNPAMCLRHLLTDDTHGIGIDGSEIDDASFEAAADICDQTVSGKKRFELNLVIASRSYAQAWIDTICTHFCAQLYRQDGLWKLWVDVAASDSGILFDTSNSKDWSLSETPVSERPGRVVVEYPRAANKYAGDKAISEVSATETRESIYKLDGVTDPDQAQRLADYLLKVQTLASMRVTFTASPLAARLSRGTRFKLTFPNGCTAQDFVATEIEPLDTGEYKISAREYDANVYTSSTITPAPAPLTPPPSPWDTPPDVTIDSATSYEVLTTSSATQETYAVYRKITFTYPSTYAYGDSLVIRGKTDSSIGSDLPWASLTGEVTIPVTGNIPGTPGVLYWPVPYGSRVKTYYANGEPLADVSSYDAVQVTVRIINAAGMVSAGVTDREASSAMSTSSSADGGQGTLTGRELKLLETTGNGTSGWSITTPAALSANRTLTLPDASPVVGVMAVDASGNVSFRKDFSFSAHKNGTDQTSISANTYTKITYGTESFDVGAGYDAANSRFLPGVSGKYLITAALALTPDATDSQLQIALYANGALVKAANFSGSDSARLLSAVITSVLDLGASDYVEVYVRHQKSTDGTVSGSSSVTYFSGCRVG